jgi:FKBP-type peptidyl-prolyl cis-trans isomerase FkpA
MHPAVSATAAPVFETQDQEMMYFWGTTFGKQLEGARISDPKELEWIMRGLQDQAAGKAPSFGAEYPSLLNNYLVRRTRDAAKAEEALSLAYVTEMAREPGAVTSKTGLVYRELARGNGAQPTRESKVTVHYTGTLRDGQVFDSSRERGSPLQTRLTSVIACWSEGIPMMKVGGKARITCPPELGYGERGHVKIPGGAALTFDVELLEVAE